MILAPAHSHLLRGGVKHILAANNPGLEHKYAVVLYQLAM